MQAGLREILISSCNAKLEKFDYQVIPDEIQI